MKMSGCTPKPALVAMLSGPSPLPGRQKQDVVMTTIRPEGLFFLVMISPQSTHLAGGFYFNGFPCTKRPEGRMEIDNSMAFHNGVRQLLVV
jgi:hypothetical protein